MSILTGRNIATAGEFDTYILYKEIPNLVAHENSTFQHFEINRFCAIYSVNECVIGFQTCSGLCIDACLWCCWKQLLLCVDYFATVNRASYHGNVWRWSDFRFTFVHVKKPKSASQFFFTFSPRWITNLFIHRKIKILTLFGDTLRMCRFACSYTISN